jgi:CBS domain-containing protein
MESPIRRPEEILAYRSLRQILAGKPRAVWSVAPADPVLKALELMAANDIGFVVVLDNAALVGVLSERDCTRRVALAQKPVAATPVADVMVRSVVTVDPGRTFAECLKLMHEHAIRHLPVVESGRVVAVVSIRDLLAEAVTHHRKIIAELERERLTIFTSTA